MAFVATHQLSDKLLNGVSLAGSCRCINKKIISKMKFINIE